MLEGAALHPATARRGEPVLALSPDPGIVGAGRGTTLVRSASACGRPDVPPPQPLLHRCPRPAMTGSSLPQHPNFIYIGPDKAGSSWLHEILRRHPQVYMPPAKGLYFFDRYYDRGLSWYLSQFTGARPEHLVRGEVCQDYLFHPDVPDRIAESLGSLEMMVTLRDPADPPAFSSYLHMLRSGWEPGTFEEALDRYSELIEHGRYATHLERFVQRFGRTASTSPCSTICKRTPRPSSMASLRGSASGP